MFAKYRRMNFEKEIVFEVRNIVDYWTMQQMTEREKLEGIAFSILVKFDEYLDSSLHEQFSNLMQHYKLT